MNRHPKKLRIKYSNRIKVNTNEVLVFSSWLNRGILVMIVNDKKIIIFAATKENTHTLFTSSLIFKSIFVDEGKDGNVIFKFSYLKP